MVKLGDKVVDLVSGFAGTAVAEHRYLNGCTRVSVQPPVDKDGKLPPIESFDEPQLSVVALSVLPEGSQDTGGPAKYEDVRRC